MNREHKRHIVAVNAIIKNKEGDKILIVKRHKGEVAFPSKWAFPGGKVEREETVMQALKKEVKEEVGLEIEDEKKYLKDFTFVRPDDINVVGLIFLVTAKNIDVKLSEDFEDYAWVTEEEFKDYDYIPGMEEEVKMVFHKDVHKQFPKASCAVLVEKDGKFLLGERAKVNYQGFWVIPGGRVDFGEKLEDAAVREVKEETNIDVELVKFLGWKEIINIPGNYHRCVFFYLGKPKNTNIKVSDDLLQAKFFSMDEIKKLKNLAASVEWVLKKEGYWKGSDDDSANSPLYVNWTPESEKSRG
ncbi:MAG: NUDIX domain-containing protein [archaeon]